MSASPKIIHATALWLADGGVLLMGDSGSGKSSLALALCCSYSGKLVADDRVQLTAQKGKIYARLPPRTDNNMNGQNMNGQNMGGMCEARGFGLVRLPHRASAKLGLAVRLVPRAKVPRLPAPAYYHYADLRLPLLQLHGFDMATPQLIMLALAHLQRDGFVQSHIYTPLYSNQKTYFGLHWARKTSMNIGQNIGKLFGEKIK